MAAAEVKVRFGSKADGLEGSAISQKRTSNLVEVNLPAERHGAAACRTNSSAISRVVRELVFAVRGFLSANTYRVRSSH